MSEKALPRKAVWWVAGVSGGLTALTMGSHFLLVKEWLPRTLTCWIAMVGCWALAALSANLLWHRRNETNGSTVLLRFWLVVLPFGVGLSWPVLLAAADWYSHSTWLLLANTVLIVSVPLFVWSTGNRLKKDQTRLGLNLTAISLLICVALSAARPHVFPEGKDGVIMTWGFEMLSAGRIWTAMLVGVISGVFGTLFVAIALAGTARDYLQQSPASSQKADLQRERGGVAIALSGGGIRAMVVALGMLERIEKAGHLSKVKLISSVSGGGWALGAILAARLNSKEDSGTAVQRAIKQARLNRDYLGLSRGWRALVTPLLQTAVSTLLVLLGAGLAMLSALAGLLYLDALRDEKVGEIHAPLLQPFSIWLKDFSESWNERVWSLGYIHPTDGVEFLAAARGLLLGLFLACLAAFAIGALVVTSGQIRERWIQEKIPFLRHPTLIKARNACIESVPWSLAAGMVVLFVYGLLFSTKLALLALVTAVVGAIVSYSLDISVARISLMAAVATTVFGLLGDHLDLLPKFIEQLEHWRLHKLDELIGGLAHASNELGLAMKWNYSQQTALLVIASAGGLAFFFASWMLSLERLGLSRYWRDRLAAAFWSGDVLTWDAIRNLKNWPQPIFNVALNSPSVEGQTLPFVFRSTAWGELGKESNKEPPCSPADALAISSAALNSQGGASIPGSLRGLLSFVPLKLGRWLRAPATEPEEWQPSTLEYVLIEALGNNDPSLPWLFVSDGGHHDNLGLTSLLAERAPFDTIICLDAAADPEYVFGDFATTGLLAGKANWKLEVPLHDLLPSPEPEANLQLRTSEKLVTEGTATLYEKEEIREQCRLVYCKSALAKTGLSTATWAYARGSKEFPQEMTGDQHFDALQFEAYLDVGRAIGDEVLELKPFDLPAALGASSSAAARATVSAPPQSEADQGRALSST